MAEMEKEKMETTFRYKKWSGKTQKDQIAYILTS